jgi:hypothetical protein
LSSHWTIQRQLDSQQHQQQQQQHQQQEHKQEEDMDNAVAQDEFEGDVDAYDSSDEEYNQRNFGIYPALPVEGEPDWSLSE